MVILNPFQLQWITTEEGITLATETTPAEQIPFPLSITMLGIFLTHRFSKIC